MIDLVPTPSKLIQEVYIFCRIYPLSRPRVRKNSAGVYQPLENQAELRHELMAYRREKPIDYPVCVEGRVFYQKPTYSPIDHISRYDVDNVAKALLDAMQECMLIKDDSLVVRLDVSKAYSSEDYLILKIYDAEQAPEETL